MADSMATLIANVHDEVNAIRKGQGKGPYDFKNRRPRTSEEIMSDINKDNPTDGSVPKCECGCGMPAFRNRWGWTKYRRGHSPKEEKVVKTLCPRKLKEHTDDSRPSLPIREVSHEEFDAMAKASDPTYKAPERPIQTTRFPMREVPLPKVEVAGLKFPKVYPEAGEGLDDAQWVPAKGQIDAIPSRSGLFLIATSLAAFLAGLIIGRKRIK